MIWHHVSSLLTWHRPAVGVLRAEQEFARGLLRQQGPARFCAFDRSRGLFVEVPAAWVQAAIEPSAAFEPQAQPSWAELPLAHPEPGSAFVSLGLDWDTLDHAALLNFKHRHGLAVTLVCYDLIAVRHPEFFEGVHRPGRFAAYLADLAWCADDVACISRYTCQDLQAFLLEAGAPQPRLHTVRLGCDLPDDSAQDTSALTGLQDRPFVLFVSTLERRKNHDLMFRAWRALRRKGLVPHRLVCVGMRGWGVEGLLDELHKDPLLQEDVRVLHHVGDAALATLYRHCAFTVYPSWAEGWGLPVVESLAHGRLCLASDTTSLPEAGGGWAEHLSPHDEAAWVQRLHELMQPSALQAAHERIAAGFTPPRWADMAAALAEIASQGANASHLWEGARGAAH